MWFCSSCNGSVFKIRTLQLVFLRKVWIVNLTIGCLGHFGLHAQFHPLSFIYLSYARVIPIEPFDYAQDTLCQV
jgi:hypothetical protein